MAETTNIHKLQHLHFTSDTGEHSQSELDTLIKEVRDRGVTDLFMFAHGLNDNHDNCENNRLAKDAAIRIVKERGAGDLRARRVLGASPLLWRADSELDLVRGILHERAKNIGTKGMWTVLTQLKDVVGEHLNVHLSGHSTGTIPVAYAAYHSRGLNHNARTLVKSLFLLQSILPTRAFYRPPTSEDGGYGMLAGTELQIDGPIVVTQASEDSMLWWSDKTVDKNPIGRVGLELCPPHQSHAKVGLDQIGAPLDFSGKMFWTLDIGGAVGSEHGMAVYDQRVAWAHLALAGVVEGRHRIT